MSELPTKNGIYWYQLDPKSRADIVQVDDGNVYYIGEATPLSLAHHTSGKFFGPVSLSDFEQLAALRKAANSAIRLIDEGYGSMAVAALREALKDRKS